MIITIHYCKQSFSNLISIANILQFYLLVVTYLITIITILHRSPPSTWLNHIIETEP